MPQQLITFVLFIQLPCAIFVYVDARRRGMTGFWLWVVGVAVFMPFFLPFYILLRPRRGIFLCPNCGTRNPFPVEKCRNCELEIKQDAGVIIQGEWSLSDAISIFALSVFTLPMSLMGLFVALELMERDTPSWIYLFFASLVGTAVLVGLPLWLIIRVCRRPLDDIGLIRGHLFRDIMMAVVLVVPVLFMAHVVEEAVIKTVTTVVPSQAEAVRKLQEEEHRIGAEIWPESRNELVKLIGSAILIVFLAPLGEEMVFRGIAYTALRPRGKWRALIVTSLLFALAHMQVIHFIPIFFIGLILAYLFERTGSLKPAIALHILVNLILMILWYYRPNIYT
jgi:membrane protease YdiL (CAAX protease family)